MRRILLGLFLVLVIGGGCSGSGSPNTSASSSSTTTTRPFRDPVPAAIASAVVAGVDDGTVCTAATNPAPDRAQVVTAVGAATLIAVPCEMFAYNMSYQLAIYDGSLQTIGVPTFDAESIAVVDREYLLSVGFELTTAGEFKVASKARGVGGCGDAATYRLQDRAVVLLEARSYECPAAGEGIVDPDEWPTVYTAP